MGTPFTLVGWTAREEILATDLMRVQQLWSKALQDEIKYGSADSAGAGINFLSRVPSWAPIGGTNTVTLGPGRAFVASSSGVGADDSDYQVAEWPSGVLSFTAADGTNPRIDLVVVTPATAQQDLDARNVLRD